MKYIAFWHKTSSIGTLIVPTQISILKIANNIFNDFQNCFKFFIQTTLYIQKQTFVTERVNTFVYVSYYVSFV